MRNVGLLHKKMTPPSLSFMRIEKRFSTLLLRKSRIYSIKVAPT